MAVIDIGIRQVSILCIVYHVVGAVGIVVAMVYAVAIYFAECILVAQLVLSSFTVWIIAGGILSDGHIVKAFNHSVDNSFSHSPALCEVDFYGNRERRNDYFTGVCSTPF